MTLPKSIKFKEGELTPEANALERVAGMYNLGAILCGSSALGGFLCFGKHRTSGVNVALLGLTASAAAMTFRASMLVGEVDELMANKKTTKDDAATKVPFSNLHHQQHNSHTERINESTRKFDCKLPAR